VIVLMNPPLVVVGGGVVNAGAYYLQAVRDAARANVMPELRDAVNIVPAELGDDAPLWGALALAVDTT
jgi:glucokinase